jgi:hypothetical protein
LACLLSIRGNRQGSKEFRDLLHDRRRVFDKDVVEIDQALEDEVVLHPEDLDVGHHRRWRKVGKHIYVGDAVRPYFLTIRKSQQFSPR